MADNKDQAANAAAETKELTPLETAKAEIKQLKADLKTAKAELKQVLAEREKLNKQVAEYANNLNEALGKVGQLEADKSALEAMLPPPVQLPPSEQLQITGEYPPVLEQYVKQYPKNKVFHVTSDSQVFLEADQNLAALHQQTLGSGQLTTYTI